MNNEIPLPPGKVAILAWMDKIWKELGNEGHHEMSADLIRAAEYSVGIDIFLGAVHDVGWSDAQIEQYADELNKAILETVKDPHFESIPDDKMDELFEEFYTRAGYSGE